MKKRLIGLLFVPVFFGSNLFAQKIPNISRYENYINIENPIAENQLSCQRIANGLYGLHLKSGNYEKSVFGKSKEFGDYQFYINLEFESKNSEEKLQISRGIEIRF